MSSGFRFLAIFAGVLTLGGIFSIATAQADDESVQMAGLVSGRSTDERP